MTRGNNDQPKPFLQDSSNRYNAHDLYSDQSTSYIAYWGLGLLIMSIPIPILLSEGKLKSSTKVKAMGVWISAPGELESEGIQYILIALIQNSQFISRNWNPYNTSTGQMIFQSLTSTIYGRRQVRKGLYSRHAAMTLGTMSPLPVLVSRRLSKCLSPTPRI